MLRSTKIILGVIVSSIVVAVGIKNLYSPSNIPLADCYTPKAMEEIEYIIKPINNLGLEEYIRDYCQCISRNVGKSWADDGTYNCKYIENMNHIRAKAAIVAALNKNKVKNKTLHCIAVTAGISEGDAQTILNMIFPPE